MTGNANPEYISAGEIYWFSAVEGKSPGISEETEKKKILIAIRLNTTLRVSI